MIIRTFQFIVFGTILGYGYVRWGWFDQAHLLVGCSALAAIAIPWMVILRRGRRSQKTKANRRERHDHQHPLRALVVALLLSGIALGWSAVTFAVFDSLPILPSFYDKDRPHFESIAVQMESHRAFAELARLINERRKSRLSAAWQRTLAEREYRCWVKAARMVNGAQQTEYLQSAIAVANEAGLDSDLAKEVLDHAADRMTVYRLETEVAAGQARSKSEQEQLQKAVQSQTTTVQASLAENDRLKKLAIEHIDRLKLRLLDEILASGDCITDNLPMQREKYLSALAWAEQNKLNPEAVRRKLALTDRLMAANQPAELSAGSTAEVIRTGVDFSPPFLTLDVAVLGAGGAPIQGLMLKDFRVTRAGRSASGVRMAAVSPTIRPLQLAVLIDRSGSTAGSGIEAAKAGTKLLVNNLAGRAEFKLFSFSTLVEQRSDWTADAALLATCVDPIVADGDTALLKSLEVAIAELRSRTGTKAITLFTDGSDHVGGLGLDEIIARCRQSNIAVYAIGLHTTELDPRFLSRLANETRGEFLMAERTADVATHFRQIAARLQRPFYRLAIPTEEANAGPITIRVGGKSGLVLNYASQQTSTALLGMEGR